MARGQEPTPDPQDKPRGAAHRPAGAHQVDVQLRRRLGHASGSGTRCSSTPRTRASTRTSATSGSRATSSRRCPASYTLASSSQIYGKVSAVGERTYGSVPEPFGQDVSSFGPEDLYIGWRSGKSLSIGENALDFTVGRAPYQLGHGFLLYDGAAEGGSRGGYWTNARKAFEFAAIGRFKPGPHTVEVFYLDKDELAGERQRQPAVGRQLRVHAPATIDDARRDLHEVVRRPGPCSPDATG